LDTNLLKQFGKVLSREKAKVNQRIAIFTFFLIVASILWYLNKLSYEYDTELVYPVRFENFPKGKVMVGEPPHNLKIGVKAYGYTLLRYKLLASISPLIIDLNKTSLLPQRDSESMFYITAARMRSPIISQLRGELQLLSVLPDTVFFELTSLVQRKVVVKPDLKFSFDKQYMQSGPITIDPDSITISGPKTIVDTITELNTAVIRLDKLTSSVEKYISIIHIPQVGLSHRKVLFKIPVEKYTEATFSTPIEIRNLPQDIQIVLLPRAVNIKCNVPIGQYANLNSRSFNAFVDYSYIQISLGNKLPVQIESKDEFIGNFDFEPKYVEFIIENK
jgi:hypothetical protein